MRQTQGPVTEDQDQCTDAPEGEETEYAQHALQVGAAKLRQRPMHVRPAVKQVGQKQSDGRGERET